MANNRLLLRNKQTGETYCLAKTMAAGWYESHEFSYASLFQWLNSHDESGAYGGDTELELLDENNLSNRVNGKMEAAKQNIDELIEMLKEMVSDAYYPFDGFHCDKQPCDCSRCRAENLIAKIEGNIATHTAPER